VKKLKAEKNQRYTGGIHNPLQLLKKPT